MLLIVTTSRTQEYTFSHMHVLISSDWILRVVEMWHHMPFPCLQWNVLDSLISIYLICNELMKLLLNFLHKGVVTSLIWICRGVQRSLIPLYSSFLRPVLPSRIWTFPIVGKWKTSPSLNCPSAAAWFEILIFATARASATRRCVLSLKAALA